MRKKAVVSMSFNWMFALIAGGIILFLAFFVAGRLLETGETTASTITAKQFLNTFDPLETGIASGKADQVVFPKPVRIYFETCSHTINSGFGRQTIMISEQSLGNKWGENSTPVATNDKYVFAEKTVEGKQISLFTRPFKMPFKISDLLVISSKDYCFFQAPIKVKRDLEGLRLDFYNVHFTDNIANCTGTLVCFDNPRRECKNGIRVFGVNNYETGTVVKNNKNMYFYNNLLYAAIFSDVEIYECNLKRLINRLIEQSHIYLDKIIVMQRTECRSTLNTELLTMISSAKTYTGSEDFNNLVLISKEIDKKNSRTRSACQLYQDD
jgi:hypothetical protein